MKFDKQQLLQEVTVRVSRSSGAGGQHVNKVSTKIELIFNITQSEIFNQAEKNILHEKLLSKTDKEGAIHITCQDTRSQLLNKQLAFDKLYYLLKNALKVKPKRIATKIPQTVKLHRKAAKQANAFKKEARKKPFID